MKKTPSSISSELKLNPEYVVDNKGKKIKVILEINQFEKIIDDLEDLYFGLLSQKAMKEKKKFVDWEETKKRLLK